MSSTFQQEVETQEAVSNLHRKILEIEHGLGEEERTQIMVTVSPDFQMKVDVYSTISFYQQDHARKIFGWPWFSVMGQEENYRVWKRM